MVEHTTFPRNLYGLENHIDRALSNLRIYRLPLELALIVSLTIFEDLLCRTYGRVPDGFSTEAAMLQHKAGLQILIPEIYRRCPQPTTENKAMQVTLDVLADVSDALNFCQSIPLIKFG